MKNSFPISKIFTKNSALPSGVGDRSRKTKVHIISSGSNDNASLPLCRQSFCVHAHRLSFYRLGSLPYYHLLSLRNPDGEGFLNLPLKTNFTKKFRNPLEIGESSGYCKGIGHDNPKQAAVSVKDETSRKNTFLTRSILGEWCRFNPGVSCFTLSTHSPFFCALTSARKNTEKSSKQGGKHGRQTPSPGSVRKSSLARAEAWTGAIPNTSDLVLFPHLGGIQNKEKSIWSNRARRSGNRRQGGDLFVHLFPSGQGFAQARNQIHSPAQLSAKGEVTSWTTRKLSSSRQSPLSWLSPRSFSPLSQSFRNQYRRKHSMTRLCSKITTSSSIIAKEILKTAALSLFGAAIAFAAMGIEWVLR